MMTLERRRDLITVLKPYFLPKRLHSTRSYFIKAIDHTFYGFTSVITHTGCWENTRNSARDLQAFRVRAFRVCYNNIRKYITLLDYTTVYEKSRKGLSILLLSQDPEYHPFWE